MSERRARAPQASSNMLKRSKTRLDLRVFMLNDKIMWTFFHWSIAFLWDSGGNILSALERTHPTGTETRVSQIRNWRKSPRQRKTFPSQNPLTQMTISLDEELDITTTCNLIILDRYAALILFTDFIKRYYLCNLASLYNTLWLIYCTTSNTLQSGRFNTF